MRIVRSHGEYLVNLAGCAECHTQSEKGQPKPGMLFAGGERFAFPGAVVVSANITPDLQSGIGRWSEKDFLDRFQQYREYAENASPRSGPENFTIMPWLDVQQAAGRRSAGDLRIPADAEAGVSPGGFASGCKADDDSGEVIKGG